ncbi:unnamed protein product, partial [Allacma fusca]
SYPKTGMPNEIPPPNPPRRPAPALAAPWARAPKAAPPLRAAALSAFKPAPIPAPIPVEALAATSPPVKIPFCAAARRFPATVFAPLSPA